MNNLRDNEMTHIRERYEAGETLTQIARHYSTSIAVIKPILQESGVGVRRVGNSPLTVEDVLDIKDRLGNGEKGSHLAEEYGVTPTTISGIKNGKVWADVQ